MLLEVEDLTVQLPGGAVIVERTNLSVAPGQIIAILGPSGSGKSTLLRAVFSAAELRRRGFHIAHGRMAIHAEAAFVPQRGALFDHLDVRGNIALAQAGGRLPVDAAPWLEAVQLDASLGERGHRVATLSGGQAQRVAVARTLAAGRRLLVLDEPSVGLDPEGVRSLARLLVEQARQQQVGMLLITHDLALAGGASSDILFLDPAARTLTSVAPDWTGPAEQDDAERREQRLVSLEREVGRRLLAKRSVRSKPARRRLRLGEIGRPLRIAGASLLRAFDPHLFRQSLVVLWLSLVQALFKPLLFYATVAVLLGFTVPYVVVHISVGLEPAVLLRLVGGSYILSLAPALSAIVFAATSGSAINAWLGGLGLRGQVLALEGLGISPARYLWSPSWLALVGAYLTTAGVFFAAMTAGGWLLFDSYGVPHALDVLTADVLDPAPERLPYRTRGAWLVVAYAVAIASIVVAKGSEAKERAQQVTAAMTSAVIRATLFVVAVELVSIGLLFSLTGR